MVNFVFWKWQIAKLIVFDLSNICCCENDRQVSHVTLRFKNRVQHTRAICKINFGPFDKHLKPKFFGTARGSIRTVQLGMKTVQLVFLWCMDRKKRNINTLYSSPRRVTPPTRIPLRVLLLFDDELRFDLAVRSNLSVRSKNFNLLVFGVGMKKNNISACVTLIATSYTVLRYEANNISVNHGTQIRKRVGSVLQFGPHITYWHKKLI